MRWLDWGFFAIEEHWRGDPDYLYHAALDRLAEEWPRNVEYWARNTFRPRSYEINVGIEDVDDLKADLDSAMRSSVA